MSQPWARRKSRSARVALVPGQDHQVGVAGHGRTRRQEGEVDVGIGPQRVELVEIGDPRQHRHDDPHALVAVGADRPFQHHGVLGGQGAGRGQPRAMPRSGQPVRATISRRPSSNSEGSPRNLLMMKPLIRSRSAASSTRWAPARAAITWPRSMSPTRATGTPAAWAKPMLAMSPARRLVSAGLPRPLDQHQVGLGGQLAIGRHSGRQQVGLQALEGPRLVVSDHLAQHHHLGPDVALGLQQNRIHLDRRRGAAGQRLQGLGPADLAAVGGDRGVVGHVLRLERPHDQAAIGEQPAQPRHQGRLAHVRTAALDHQRGHGRAYRAGRSTVNRAAGARALGALYPRSHDHRSRLPPPAARSSGPGIADFGKRTSFWGRSRTPMAPT